MHTLPLVFHVACFAHHSHSIQIWCHGKQACIHRSWKVPVTLCWCREICLLNPGSLLILHLGCQMSFWLEKTKISKVQEITTQRRSHLLQYAPVQIPLGYDFCQDFYKKKLEVTAQAPRKLHNIFSSHGSTCFIWLLKTLLNFTIRRLRKPARPSLHRQVSPTPLPHFSTIAVEEILQVKFCSTVLQSYHLLT